MEWTRTEGYSDGMTEKGEGLSRTNGDIGDDGVLSCHQLIQLLEGVRAAKWQREGNAAAAAVGGKGGGGSGRGCERLMEGARHAQCRHFITDVHN